MVGFPDYIVESKNLCEKVYCLDPYDIPNPNNFLPKNLIEAETNKYNEIVNLTKLYMRKLLTFMKDVPTVIAITNKNGYIIDIFGDETLYNKLNIAAGSLYDEVSMGTNSISLSLRKKRPIQVTGNEHYHYIFHGYSCSTSPFSFPDSTDIGGTISLMTEVEQASRFHLGLLTTTVEAIERDLQLQYQNQRLHILNQILIRTNSNGIIMTDQHGSITEFNRFSEELFQKKRHEIIGKPFEEFLAFGDSYIQSVLQEGLQFNNIEVRLNPHYSEKIKICIMDALPIYDKQNTIIGAYAQFRDITERYELEQQMIANERLSTIGKLSAGLAHEIRNPLTPVSGFIQLLNKQFTHTEESKRYFSIIFNELDRIKDLVNDFVLMAKPETPFKKECSIQGLLKETISLMSSEARLLDVEINLSMDQNQDVYLYIDKKQIKQVIINLLQNALEVTEKGEPITIDCVPMDQQICISITDLGPGMSLEEQTNLFTPFYTTKENGIGLGLSICERIIKNHHGLIKVHSQKGHGTTFEVLLPITN